MMQNDEKEIRQLIDTWLAATKARDTKTVLSLMTEDAVFLVPGQPAMRKQDFANIAELQAKQAAPDIDGVSDIQEIKIVGEWAFMWTKLQITVTPNDSVDKIVRAGHTLSILKKENEKWLLARDANLLAQITKD